MGVPNLFKVLKKPQTCRLKNMSGQRAAVDISIWIYQAHSVNANPTLFVRDRLFYLHHCGVTPLVVFDGQVPEAKLDVIEERKRVQELKLEKLRDLKVNRGRRRTEDVQEAIKMMCRKEGFEYLVSPFETDSQIAHLLKTEYVDFGITEDSDFLVYGCDKVAYKLCRGVGLVYGPSIVESSLGARFDLESFQACCILLGCDYLPKGLPGFGPKRVPNLYKELVKSGFSYKRMVQVVAELGANVPKEFEAKFWRALYTFRHQLVYDVYSEQVIPLSPWPADKTSNDFTFVPYRCKHCDESFPSGILRRMHHNIEHPLLCLFCGKSYDCFSKLEAHMRVHTGEKPYFCKICGVGVQTMGALKEHKFHSGVKPFQCSLCDKAFATPRCLKSHHRSIHEKPLKCESCGKSFGNKQDLKIHSVVHSGEKAFICDLCGKSFTQAGNLKLHMLRHAGKPFKCDRCNKGYSRKEDLNAHLVIHAGDKPFKCGFCSFGPICAFSFISAYGRAGHLKRHKMSHAGEKPFKCPKCPKGFIDRNKLNRHLLTHRESAQIVSED